MMVLTGVKEDPILKCSAYLWEDGTITTSEEEWCQMTLRGWEYHKGFLDVDGGFWFEEEVGALGWNEPYE
jgi:hypothetical protein